MDQREERLCRYGLLFLALSFLGWGAETLFFSLCLGGLHDRGFLGLPLCTIYGFAFLLTEGLLGTPGDRRVPLPVYVGLAALVPTGLELVTGVLFHRVFGLRLWSYEAYRFHFRGYICLEFTLLWALLLPLAMAWVFRPLKAWVFSLPTHLVRPLAGSLLLLTALDWLRQVIHALE